MSRYIKGRNSGPVINAAQMWIEKCLIHDDSIFSDRELWTVDNIKLLDEFFVRNPDDSSNTFYEKLQNQLSGAGPDAQCTMAEMLWALLLFPSNISIDTKRTSIIRVWSWSGEALSPDHALLTDEVLAGIGSCGMAINNHRWRELNYMIGLVTAIKKLTVAARERIFFDYKSFLTWVNSVERSGERQFRHMLRYFLFPDVVERISTNRDRRSILERFDNPAQGKTKKLNDQELDDALLILRKSLEKKFDTPDLDFYSSPLREVWKLQSEADDGNSAGDVDDRDLQETDLSQGLQFEMAEPRNLILYGPAGTGKTYRLQQLRDEYSDQPADVDRKTWEMALVSEFGWRATIAAALASFPGPVKVGELIAHPLMLAKALQRQRKTPINATAWSYLQEHTPPDVGTVKTAIRRTPAVFTKSDQGAWSLVRDWRERDIEALELEVLWSKGPEGTKRPIQRYRFVTFHPSYSYEDFVTGLRPVSIADDDGQTSTGFRMVDGVFKQICVLAKANPQKRYALFIDEINRANIAKVFGELITLIEADKRARYDRDGVLIGGIEVQLPGIHEEGESGDMFGVPANLDIYATMNTADRSIALLDIALRRRFEFEALDPDYTVIDRRVDTVDLRLLLQRLNARLEYLSDRDKQIGHAYFSRVKDLKELQASFKLQIIPLLQEYFFDDWANVAAVLSDFSGKSAFVEKSSLHGSELFTGHSAAPTGTRAVYRVTDTGKWTAEAFRALYESPPVAPSAQAAQ